MTVYAGVVVEYFELFSVAGVSTNLFSPCGNQFGEFSENWKSIYFKTQQYHFWTYTQKRHNQTTRTFAQL